MLRGSKQEALISVHLQGFLSVYGGPCKHRDSADSHKTPPVMAHHHISLRRYHLWELLTQASLTSPSVRAGAEIRGSCQSVGSSHTALSRTSEPLGRRGPLGVRAPGFHISFNAAEIGCTYRKALPAFLRKYIKKKTPQQATK